MTKDLIVFTKDVEHLYWLVSLLHTDAFLYKNCPQRKNIFFKTESDYLKESLNFVLNNKSAKDDLVSILSHIYSTDKIKICLRNIEHESIDISRFQNIIKTLDTTIPEQLEKAFNTIPLDIYATPLEIYEKYSTKLSYNRFQQYTNLHSWCICSAIFFIHGLEYKKEFKINFDRKFMNAKFIGAFFGYIIQGYCSHRLNILNDNKTIRIIADKLVIGEKVPLNDIKILLFNCFINPKEIVNYIIQSQCVPIFLQHYHKIDSNKTDKREINSICLIIKNTLKYKEIKLNNLLNWMHYPDFIEKKFLNIIDDYESQEFYSQEDQIVLLKIMSLTLNKVFGKNYTANKIHTSIKQPDAKTIKKFIVQI